VISYSFVEALSMLTRRPTCRFAQQLGGLSKRYLTSSDFSKLEHDMWQSGAEAYDNTFGKVTSQATIHLLDAAGVERRKSMMRRFVSSVTPATFPAVNAPAVPSPRAPMEAALPVEPANRFRVLDVATGPGMIASEAAARGADEVVGVDISSEMLVRAKPVAEAYPGVVSFELGDAEALPVTDSSFDAVIIGFGLLHLPSPQLAIDEAFRVLKPGGRLAFSVWDEPERSLGFGLILDAIAKHGDPHVKLPAGPDGKPPLPFFHFASAKNSTAALTSAGFEDVVFQRIPVQAALPDVDSLFQMCLTATARTRAMLEMNSEAQRQAIRASMAAEVRARFSGVWLDGKSRTTSYTDVIPGTDAPLFDGRPSGRNAVMIPMDAVVVSAAKPH